MRNYHVRSSYRLDHEKLDSQLQKRLLIRQKTWFLVVLARFLSLLILILVCYLERF